MCSVQLVNPLWMSLLFGCPVIGRKSESYKIAQISILCLAQFLDMHSVALFIWLSLLNTCFSHGYAQFYEIQVVVLERHVDFLSGRTFWINLLLHCIAIMVWLVLFIHNLHFLKCFHLIYFRKLYSLVLCPLYAFITCDAQLNECSWLEVTWLVLQFFSSYSHGIEFTFTVLYIHIPWLDLMLLLDNYSIHWTQQTMFEVFYLMIGKAIYIYMSPVFTAFCKYL